MVELLRRHVWAVFLAHQLLIFTFAVGFLTSVRRITGRTIHLGRDPIGLIDGAALVVLSVLVMVITWALYRWVKGEEAPPLGIAPSRRRLMDLIAGLVVGFGFAVSPYIVALWRNTATINDWITTHVSHATVIRILGVAFFLLLLQSVVEETANRAFPMRLWDQRSLLFRIVIPSIFFAALHLADEQFSLERIVVLILAGVVQSLAYAITGNIWLTSGVHAGANTATFSVSGLWHAGAIVSMIGRPGYPTWITAVLMLAVFSVAFALSRRYKISQC